MGGRETHGGLIEHGVNGRKKKARSQIHRSNDYSTRIGGVRLPARTPSRASSSQFSQVARPKDNPLSVRSRFPWPAIESCGKRFAAVAVLPSVRCARWWPLAGCSVILLYA